MSSFRPFLLFISVAAIGRAQSIPVSPNGGSAPGPVQHLEKFVVSAGADPKSALDLAQGTNVVTGDDLRRQLSATLGETLAGTAGVTATANGAGASRPIIRGLGGDRVRVLDNGVGALDVSNVSPDHQTALEPFFASSIEVLRGPSAILYGSSAVGGVVNVIDNTIPEVAPDGTVHGDLLVRGATATQERAGLLSLGGGARALAGHLNLMRRTTENIRIPGVARVDAAAPANQRSGRLADSATDTTSASGGATMFWAAGQAGIGLTRYETEYGIPGDEPGLINRMHRTRVDFSGALSQPFGIFRSAKARIGAGSYTHSEFGEHGAELHTTFHNDAAEGRIDLAHAPIGRVTGTVGVQGSRTDFSANGEEAVTPPSLTHTGAVFALEEMKLTPMATLQIGGRLEYQNVKLGAVAADLPAVPGYFARSDERKTFFAPGASVGIVLRPGKDWSIGAALAYTERPPTTQELFSNGPHGATRAYEIGTSALGNEKSTGFDVNVRRRIGAVTGSISAFVNRFADYIFEQGLSARSIPAGHNPDGLAPFQFIARDAKFHGGEAEIEFHVVDAATHQVHIAFMADYVRAQNATEDQPLPRMPPLRYGVRLAYEGGALQADAEVRRADRQRHLAPDEAATDGYTIVNAGVSYAVPHGRQNYEFFLRGTNLTNVTARENTSFLKQFAPQPGRGVAGGIRLSF